MPSERKPSKPSKSSKPSKEKDNKKSSKDEKKKSSSSSSKSTNSKTITTVETTREISAENGKTSQTNQNNQSTYSFQPQNTLAHAGHPGLNLGHGGLVQRGLGAGLGANHPLPTLTQGQGPFSGWDQVRESFNRLPQNPDDSLIVSSAAPTTGLQPAMIYPTPDFNGGVPFPAGRDRGPNSLMGRLDIRNANNRGWPIVYTQKTVVQQPVVIQQLVAPVLSEEKVLQKRIVTEKETTVTRRVEKISSHKKTESDCKKEGGSKEEKKKKEKKDGVSKEEETKKDKKNGGPSNSSGFRLGLWWCKQSLDLYGFLT